MDPKLELAARLDPSFLMELAGFPSVDPWQATALRSGARRLLLLAARQTGKSTTTAFIALHDALFRDDSLILLVSRSARQSGELFRRMMEGYEALGRPVESVRELAHSLELGNGSRIIALPSDPATIRCFSGVWAVIIDEAAQCSDDIMPALAPMLGTTGGRLLALSTPYGKRGFFHELWNNGDPSWERHRSVATECPRISREFIEEQRRLLGQRMFDQEMCCEFVEMEGQLFPQDAIDRAFTDTDSVSVLQGF
jgi:hypothetical protein